MDVELELRWFIEHAGGRHALDPVVFALLRGIRSGGHLNHAAQAAGVSYRHAWGLLRDWEGRFGKPLIVARQGRGAHLSELGEALLEIAQSTDAALVPALEAAALEAAAGLSDAVDPRRHAIAIISSHNERMFGLRDVLRERHRVSFDVAGSEQALHR
ncbi:MAG: winged helix-turn-helix domain-containing protein, partial [Gammaproteobacteria bacterium]